MTVRFLVLSLAMFATFMLGVVAGGNCDPPDALEIRPGKQPAALCTVDETKASGLVRCTHPGGNDL